jgi:hypothetical protein
VLLGSDIARSVSGLYLGACALLVIAGVGKVRHPAPTRAAVFATGLRVPGAVVVAFGLGEVTIGVVGGALGGRSAFAVAAAYLVLTVFAVVLLVRAPTTPCACLGSAGAPVSRAHVAINAGALGVAAAAASGGSPFAQFSGRWFAAAVFLVLVGCCVKLAALVLEELPQLAAAGREGRA